MLQYDQDNSDFEHAVKNIRLLTVRPTDNELLELYGLYKQATIGNNNTHHPGILNIKESAKWNSWKRYSGKGKNWSKHEYISLVKKLLNKYQSKKS